MATISLTYTVSPSDQTRVVNAYQNDANTDLGSTANASQVLAYIQKIVKNEIVNRVQSSEAATAQAALPAITPVAMT